MFKNYLVILLLSHVFADFYFFSRNSNEKKVKNKFSFLIYSVIMVIFGVLFFSAELHVIFPIILIVHLIICLCNYKLTEKSENLSNGVNFRNLFFVDQLLHLLLFICISYWMTHKNIQINEYRLIDDLFQIADFSKYNLSVCILSILLIEKPGNIIIQKILMSYKPDTEQTSGDKKNFSEEVKDEKNAGRFIGTLERLLMFIFLAFNDYSSIGLILTAKSIARYDRISKDQVFAEYYLLGTLLSTLVVLIVSFLYHYFI